VIDATWAGRPPSGAELRSEKMFRSRDDFAAHRAPLDGASRPWLESEVMLAAQFAAAIGDFWSRQQRGITTPTSLPAFGAGVFGDGQAAESPPEVDVFAFAPAPASAGRWNSLG